MTLFVSPHPNNQPDCESKNTARLCPQDAGMSSSLPLQSGGSRGPSSITCSTTMDDTNSSKANLLTFPWLLHSLLEAAAKEGFDHIVSWHDNNASFRVHEPALFVKQVMPRFFKRQSKYKSFQRQLNIWQFERVIGSRGPCNGGYFHPYFKRNNTALFHLMQRSKLASRRPSLLSSSSCKSCLFSKESSACNPQSIARNNHSIHHLSMLHHKTDFAGARILPPHHQHTSFLDEAAAADAHIKVATSKDHCSFSISPSSGGRCAKRGRNTSLLPSIELIQGGLSSWFSLDKDNTTPVQDGVDRTSTGQQIGSFGWRYSSLHYCCYHQYIHYRNKFS